MKKKLTAGLITLGLTVIPMTPALADPPLKVCAQWDVTGKICLRYH